VRSGTPSITPSKESSHEQIPDQGDADCLFDKRGVVHYEFVPEGQTVNAAFYVQVLDGLRKRVARVRPAIKNTWRLHHDNASSHTALVVVKFLAKPGVTTLPHPPYRPDLAPPDIFLFPKIKRSLKGTRQEYQTGFEGPGQQFSRARDQEGGHRHGVQSRRLYKYRFETRR